MIDGHNQTHMTADEQSLAELPEWTDDDFNRLFPNG